MVSLTRLNGKTFFVNPHIVEFIEETPDTVITLTTGKKIVVEESAEETVARILEYRRHIASRLPKIVPPSEER